MAQPWMQSINQNWETIEAFLATLALITLLSVGGTILHHHRNVRRKDRKQMGSMRIRSSTRRVRVKHFCKVSSSILEDASDLLFRDSQMRYEARTMLPLVVEARQLGERLLRDRRKHHAWLWGTLESRIEPLIAALLIIEEDIRAIPRAAFTIEEVIEGRFECIRYESSAGHQ